MPDQRASAAAAAAVAAAEAAADLGTVQARMAYELTYQMIKQSQGGALAFPLLGLESATIIEGYVAYSAVVDQSKTQQTLAAESFQAAEKRVQSLYHSTQTFLLQK
jgi:hypothetical protein